MSFAMHPRRPAFAALVAALAFSSCECTRETHERPHRIESFGVNVQGVQVFDSSTSNTSYSAWTEDAPLPMPRVGAILQVEVWAKDENGLFLDSYENPASFRITPGNVVAVSETVEPLVEAINGGAVETLRDTNPRLLNFHQGVGRGYVLVEKVFGEAKLWAQDSPPEPVFALPASEDDEGPSDAGGPDTGLPGLDAGPDTGWEEVDGGRTYVAGLSDSIWFAAPTIADTQLLPARAVGFSNAWCPSTTLSWNNRLSPFVGNFLTIEAPPPAGDMIVTAITAEGFYVTDLLAPPITSDFYTTDPTGNRTLPGTYAHMYVYNYNYPDDLFVGHRILSITGTVQEFSGDTQMVFPSWIRKQADPVLSDLPKPTLLDFSDPQVDESGVSIDGCITANPGTHCDNGKAPTFYSLRCIQACAESNCPAGTVCVDDQACACTTTPTDSCAAAIPGSHCENGQCVGTCPETPCADGFWCVQHHCVNPADPCAGTTCPAGERCNPNTGACECGPSVGYRLSKTATYYGVPAAGTQSMNTLFAYSNNNQEIESLESALVKVENVQPTNAWATCDANGNSNIPFFRWGFQTDEHGCSVKGGWQNWMCDDSGDDTADCECNRDCVVGLNAYANVVCSELATYRTYGQWVVKVEDLWGTRINVSTRDALPDFDPRVFAQEEYKNCRVDVTGVLRQVQAARPRWLILARDESDFCCRPSTGNRCPTPDDVDAEGVAHPGMCPKCPEASQ